ncbi:hypothetical protein COO60DRAFT_1628759 [Scenedesmus sp. NREL 46B-D3]|nr:hypothetical protein COO60DRAFT_1628759 [Scenedesmus sp. NREL 46B-D3]
MVAICSEARQPGSSSTQSKHIEDAEHAEAVDCRRQDRTQTQQEATAAAHESSNDAEPEPTGFRAKLHQLLCAPTSTSQKVMCWCFWIAVVVASGVLFAVIFPRFVERVVQPFIALLRRKLTPAQIGAVVFTAMVVLPFTLVISVIPFVWVAGIVFEYWLALLIVMAGSTVAMSLQYWLARHIFHDRVERFLQRCPKRHALSVTLRAVELAGPWKVVALLRLGPFPYHWLNYVLGICPSIKYPVYIICSVIVELLPRGLQVFFGRSLETLADLLKGKVSNPGVAVYNLLVLAIGILFVVLSVIYSKRMLRKLEAEELAKEQADAAAAAAAEDLEGARSSAAGAGAPAAVVADKLRAALPLQISSKLQAGDGNAVAGSAAAGAGWDGPGSCSQGDLQVIVADASAAPNSSSLACTLGGSSWIRAGQQEAGSEGSSNGSLMSRLSSVSSLQRLLSGRASRDASSL